MEGIGRKFPLKQVFRAARFMDREISVRLIASRLRLSSQVRTEFVDLIHPDRLKKIVALAIFLKGDSILQNVKGSIISKIEYARRETGSDANTITEEMHLVSATVTLRGLLGSDIGDFRVPMDHIERINWHI
jgi:hypothetical protein